MRYTLLTILIGLNLRLLAQVNDSLYLEPIVVSIHEMKQTDNLDSALLFNDNVSIAEVLQENSSIQVQEYGAKGSVQSLLIRGLTSSHTKVKWNGLQINSLTLGMFDFGGVNGFGNNYLKLNKGANVENDGDGAIGGSVNFGSKTIYNEGFQSNYSLTAGSFGTYLLGVSTGMSKNKWAYKLSFNKESAENNFEYQNYKRIGKPIIKQNNSEFRSTNLIQEVGVKLKNIELQSVTWWNGKRKNIPNLLTESQSVKKYTADSSFRSLVKASTRLKNIRLSALLGRDKQWFEYSNPGLVFTHYIVTNDQAEIKAIGDYKNVIWNLKSNIQFQKATNTNYEGRKNRVLSLSTINAKYFIEKFKVKVKGTVGIQKSSDLGNVYPTTTLSYIKKHKNIEFVGGVGTHFRQPSFNDLFWIGGGNASLMAENGWNIEQFVKLKRTNSVFLNIGAYYSIIDNWIQWVPIGAVWMPQNVKKVNASGVECNFNLITKVKNLSLALINSSSYTRTTVIESEVLNDISIGNQAVNIPFFNSLINGRVKWVKWRFDYRLAYRGKRYISFDNNEDSALPNYWLSSLSINRKFIFKDLDLAINTRVANLFNQAYEVVGNVPMPGRSFYLSLNFKFKNT